MTGHNGNISLDPLFADPANGNYRLAVTSPSIDSGASISGTSGVDLDGLFRVYDGDGDGVAVPDMGAFEFQPPPRNNPRSRTRTGNRFILPFVP
jgi:hypothetical protein